MSDGSTDIRDIVIVGGGLAAGKAGEAVREGGFDGNLTIVTEEPERPYERPPLSKGFLLGKVAADEVFVHPAGFYDDQRIDLVVADPVTAVDRDAAEVTTSSGRRIRYDRLLLATGAAPRQIRLSEQPLDGIVTLRTLEDSRRLGERLRAVDHVTVVGAGWIGCEVAAAARTFGTDVLMVDPLQVPLERVLGTEVGRVFAGLHTDHGVDLRMGVGVSGVQGSGAVEQVSLADGATVDTQLVLVGVGVIPRVELGQQAGLEVEDGILVDETLQTNDPRIFAAGDVASAWHPWFQRRIRVEHWANALNQGTTVGRNLLGAGEPYDRLPYFYTDQYDLGMEYSGHAIEWDEVVFRGDVDGREFITFWLKDGKIAAGMNVNVWDVIEDIQRLIHSGATFEPAALGDTGTALADLGPA